MHLLIIRAKFIFAEVRLHGVFNTNGQEGHHYKKKKKKGKVTGGRRRGDRIRYTMQRTLSDSTVQDLVQANSLTCIFPSDALSLFSFQFMVPYVASLSPCRCCIAPSITLHFKILHGDLIHFALIPVAWTCCGRLSHFTLIIINDSPCRLWFGPMEAGNCG